MNKLFLLCMIAVNFHLPVNALTKEEWFEQALKNKYKKTVHLFEKIYDQPYSLFNLKRHILYYKIRNLEKIYQKKTAYCSRYSERDLYHLIRKA